LGFVVNGMIPQKVLIRAVGPTLSQFGVTNPIQHTTLTIFSGSSAIGSNTGWSSANTATTAQLSQTFATAGAFTLPVGSGDSAIIVTLSPGAYTAVAQGVSTSDSGVVLVEAYLVQ
jgi:hypothetical protein